MTTSFITRLASGTDAQQPLRLAPKVIGSPRKPAQKPPSPFRGMGSWMFGAQRHVWRPSRAGMTEGYDAFLRLAYNGHTRHFVRRSVSTLALGGTTSGFEGQGQSLMAFGAGAYTFDKGIAYGRIGYDIAYARNPRVNFGLLAPLLELGHLWATSGRVVDVGLRIDVPVLGGFTIEAWSDRYRHRLDLSGYLNAEYGPLLLELEAGQRRLKHDAQSVLHVSSALCGGATVVVCARGRDYWLSDSSRHITELTFSVGIGAFTTGR